MSDNQPDFSPELKSLQSSLLSGIDAYADFHMSAGTGAITAPVINGVTGLAVVQHVDDLATAKEIISAKNHA
jgi:hypothetical protein